jgi:hypothetical protein
VWSSVGLLSLIGFVNAVVGKQTRVLSRFYHAGCALDGNLHRALESKSERLDRVASISISTCVRFDEQVPTYSFNKTGM